MKYLRLILVVVMVALVADQVLARRINEKHGQPEHSRTKRALNDKFRSFLEKARDILREGNSTLGIPVMDPFRNEKMEMEFDEELIKGKVEATNLEVTGISGYNIEKATISALSRKMTLGLTWSQIFAKGSYKFDALIADEIKAYGAGDFEATLTDLFFETTVWLKVSGGMAIKKMETSISLGALEFSATGILDDDDTSKIISEVISDMTPQLIQDYQQELTTYVNNMISEMVNEFLEGKSLTDIIAILG